MPATGLGTTTSVAGLIVFGTTTSLFAKIGQPPCLVVRRFALEEVWFRKPE